MDKKDRKSALIKVVKIDDPEVVLASNEVLEYSKKRELPRREDYAIHKLREELISSLNKAGLDLESDDIAIEEVPPKYEGDYALRVQKLMQSDMKKYMTEWLPKIEESLSQDSEQIGLSGVERKGPYINISLDRGKYSLMVLGDIDSLSNRYGESDLKSGSRLMIDFSSPNIGKSLHVGHVGTTILGAAISNLYEAIGYTVYRINHLGDWGTPIGLLRVGETLFGDKDQIKELKEFPAKYYSEIYAEVNAAAKEDETIREKAKDAFAQLEEGDEEMVSYWKDVWEKSVGELEQIYSSLGITFDLYLGEAAYEDRLSEVLDDILEYGIATKDGEAIVVELEKEKLGTVLMVKSDRATTYMTRDLAAMNNRKRLFGIDKTVYVVGQEQSLHFRQLFYLADKLGYMPRESSVHVPIGLLCKNGKKISSRSGGALAFEELVDDIYTACLEKSKESEEGADTSSSDTEAIATDVARAAFYYSQTSNVPGKDSEFDLETVTNTKGKSGPSLQYCAVRTRSIIEKIGEPTKSLGDISEDVWRSLDPAAFPLIRRLGEYPRDLENSIEKDTAHIFIRSLDNIREELTTLIHAVIFRDEEGDKKEAYSLLLSAAYTVLENGLGLLNCSVPSRM